MGNIAAIYGGSGFDTESVEPSTGFQPLPPGWYTVTIDNAEIKETKAGDGSYMKLTLSVIGERYANRKLFPMITLDNPNEKAVEIGMRELSALGHACGIKVVRDTDEFLGHTIEVRVKIRPAKGDYDEDNQVTAYKAVGEVEKPARAERETMPTRASGEPVPVAAPKPKRPWER